jgi:hypothetical protein
MGSSALAGLPKGRDFIDAKKSGGSGASSGAFLDGGIESELSPLRCSRSGLPSVAVSHQGGPFLFICFGWKFSNYRDHFFGFGPQFLDVRHHSHGESLSGLCETRNGRFGRPYLPLMNS